MSPEVAALAALAVFHDLRWLFGLAGHAVSAESPLQEAAEAVAQAAAAWRMPQLVTPSPPCSGSGS